jgi:hypothetical protein
MHNAADVEHISRWRGNDVVWRKADGDRADNAQRRCVYDGDVAAVGILNEYKRRSRAVTLRSAGNANRGEYGEDHSNPDWRTQRTCTHLTLLRGSTA